MNDDKIKDFHDQENHVVDPDRRAFLKAGAVGACALCFPGLFGVFGSAPPVQAQTARRGLPGNRRSPWFRNLSGGSVQCTLCPLECRLAPGQRGRCRVRENRDGTGYTLVYGNPVLVQTDPVERKPFFHVLPGSRALSVSTAGCPLHCSFCEVWDMALAPPEGQYSYELPPAEVIDHAERTGVEAISFAFGEPVAFWEYTCDTAAEARRAGLLNLVHTSGYINREPLGRIAGHLDAVNVDLKSFDPAFYRSFCDGELDPVLETLLFLRRENVHLEITNLLIPTLNDDMAMIRRMCTWIRDNLGPDVPLHFARFYPLYKLSNLPPTPVATIDRARATAYDAGLNHVYVSRVTGHEGESTWCPSCGDVVIRRLGFVIEENLLDAGRCGACGTPIPGRWT